MALTRLSLVLLAGLAAAACTPMEWIRADATPEEVQRDSVDCQQAAWREARSRDWYYAPFAGWPYRDPFGRRIFWPQGGFAYPFDDPYLEEARLAQFCMRNKGYQLQEVPRR